VFALGGSGIVLNRKAAQRLNAECECPPPDPMSHMADGNLGACMSDLKVKVVHSDGFHQVYGKITY